MGGGTVILQSGTHTVSTTISINNANSPLKIDGQGYTMVVKPNAGVSAFDMDNCKNLELRSFKLDATNYTSTTKLIDINEVNNNSVLIEELFIKGNDYGYGIHGSSDRITIQDVIIEDMHTAIYLNGANDFYLYEITISGCSTNALYINGSIGIASILSIKSCYNGIYVNSSNKGIFSNIYVYIIVQIMEFMHRILHYVIL